MRNLEKHRKEYTHIIRALNSEIPIGVVVMQHGRVKENNRGFLKILAEELEQNMPVNKEGAEGVLYNSAPVYEYATIDNPLTDSVSRYKRVKEIAKTPINYFRRLSKAYKKDGMKGIMQLLSLIRARFISYNDVTNSKGEVEVRKTINPDIDNYFKSLMTIVGLGYLPIRTENLANERV